MVQCSSFKSGLRLVLLVLIVIRGVETGRNNTPSLCFPLSLSPLPLYLWLTLLDRSHSDLTARGRHTIWLTCTRSSIILQHKYRASKNFTLKGQTMWLPLVCVLQMHAETITQRGCHVPVLKVSVTFHYHWTAAHETARTKTHMTLT